MNNQEEIKFIEKCFKELKKRKPEKFHLLNTEDIKKFPDKIIDKENLELKLLKSNISDEEILKIEQKYNFKFPSLYRRFISSFYYYFTKLDAVVDNFMYENDRKIWVDIIAQPLDAPLDQIKEVLDQYLDIIEYGYIPFAELNSCGPLCFDSMNGYNIVWLDHEEYFECESREELEEIAVNIFHNFEEFMNVFFCGIKYTCDDM